MLVHIGMELLIYGATTYYYHNQIIELKKQIEHINQILATFEDQIKYIYMAQKGSKQITLVPPPVEEPQQCKRPSLPKKAVPKKAAVSESEIDDSDLDQALQSELERVSKKE